MSETRCFRKFGPSFVDESLFGSRRTTRDEEEPCIEFDPPWITGKESKIKRNNPLLFYCPSLATSSSTGSLTDPNKDEISPSTPKTRSKSSIAKRKNQRIKFSPSYVDESLFKSYKYKTNAQHTVWPELPVLLSFGLFISMLYTGGLYLHYYLYII